MPTASQFKVGDLVSMRLSSYKLVRVPTFPMDPDAAMEPMTIITKVIARRVIKVAGDIVYIRLNGKRTGISQQQVRLVY